MKRILFAITALTAITISACNNSDKSKEGHDMSEMGSDTSKNKSEAKDVEAPVVNATFPNLDPKLSADIKTIIDHYIHIKTALVNDDAKEAASGGKAMAEAMAKLDKSLFTADQKKVYEDNEEDLREHAEHIDANANNIVHQREHFAMMSEDVYAIAKAYGGGRTLYHDHCPMYNENKGALWLSESAEIKNPYYGSKMLTCGKVQEKLN